MKIGLAVVIDDFARWLKENKGLGLDDPFLLIVKYLQDSRAAFNDSTRAINWLLTHKLDGVKLKNGEWLALKKMYRVLQSFNRSYCFAEEIFRRGKGS